MTANLLGIDLDGPATGRTDFSDVLFDGDGEDWGDFEDAELDGSWMRSAELAPENDLSSDDSDEYMKVKPPKDGRARVTNLDLLTIDDPVVSEKVETRPTKTIRVVDLVVTGEDRVGRTVGRKPVVVDPESLVIRVASPGPTMGKRRNRSKSRKRLNRQRDLCVERIRAIPVDISDWTPPTSPDGRPMTVPQPATLLTLFPDVFRQVRPTLGTVGLSDDATVAIAQHVITRTYLRGILGAVRVLGRIIAGREKRWKRDEWLDRSVKIGPAGGTGMKVVELDRPGQRTRREDVEIESALSSWAEVKGTVRAFISRTNQAIEETSMWRRTTMGDDPTDSNRVAIGPVPDLDSKMMVNVLNQADGVEVNVNSPCAVCGLYRHERVVNVDDQLVPDGFGMWWIDGAGMHRDCRNFWERQKNKLSRE